MNSDMQRCAIAKACDGGPVSPREHYRKVAGWTKVRSEGGDNALALRVELGEVACYACVKLAKMHGQDPMF